MDKVKELFIRHDRFYVRFENETGKQKTMPRANYIWLKHNPAFKEIPKGYVVHHLDLDKTNDDQSNLALMYKLHHIAYHWKHKNITPPIYFDKEWNVEYIPTKMPTVQPHGNRFYIQFMQKDNDGRSVMKKIWNRDGKTFKNKDKAEDYAKEIWDKSIRFRVESIDEHQKEKWERVAVENKESTN
jgi:hypothetical protein